MKYFALSTTIVLSWILSASARVGEGHRKLVTAPFGKAISGRYIVVLNSKIGDVLTKAKELLANSGAKVEYEYDAAIKGFSCSGLVATFLTAMLNDDMVEFVEEDQLISEDTAFNYTQSSPPNWGLDRVDSPTLPLNNQYKYTLTGKGVTIFMLDTGINLQHKDFGSRAVCGLSVISGEDCQDYRGHGSHTAGIAGGTKYGIAKNAKLVAVKVLDSQGNGSLSGVVAGVDYMAKQKAANPNTPMVANMSLGGSKSTSINTAVSGAIDVGVVVVASAGNDSGDACDKSPASLAAAITVAATDSDDSQAYYSNSGSCVDIYAPGTSITSDWYTSTTATNTISGTSMATPFVAGVAALYLERKSTMTAFEVKQAMQADGSSGVVQSIGINTVNILLSTANLGSGPTAPTPTAPTPTAPTPTAGVAPTPVAAPVKIPSSTTTTCAYLFAPCTSNKNCCSGRCRKGTCKAF